jgi:molybdopterin-containing oxidoreductase family membrane subunit
MDDSGARLEELTLAPLRRTSRGYYLLVFGLLLVLGVGVYAYLTQLVKGLAVTGMAPTVNKVAWGLYIVNFVFFIGISHAGTLISAILRVAHAEWRRPLTRIAEFVTVVALSVGALFPLIDLGRPDRILNVFIYGRWQSPILWDFLSITTYLVGSLVYLYLPLIPDLATCRDKLASDISGPKRAFYRLLAVEWRGSGDQRRNLHSALTVMMLVIMPVAISVHTVVSWIFAMTLRTGWNSTIFGAYFVAGAIFSGIATLIILMAILRKVLHLEEYITQKQFVYLGYMMAAFAMIMIYANLSEFITASYKLEEGEEVWLSQIFTGSFAPIYWFYVVGGLVLPGVIVLLPWTRNIWGIVFASILVNVAMWFERYIIVVASLRVPQTPYTDLAQYFPSAVEIMITAGAFALFGLVIAIFVKLVPVISIWEVREAHEPEPMPAPRPGVPEQMSPEPAAGA